MRRFVRTLLPSLFFLAGGVASAAPVCEVEMSQPAYIANEQVRISKLRYANLTDSALFARLRLQLALPTGPVIDLVDLGANGSLGLPIGLDRYLSPIGMFPVTTQPRGTYEIRCALEHPSTHEVLAADSASFELPAFPDRHPILLDYSFDDESPDAALHWLGLVLFEEVGPMQEVLVGPECANWSAEASFILSGPRDEVGGQGIDVDLSACAPFEMNGSIQVGPLGSIPYTVTVTSASLHYQPFAATLLPDGSFSTEEAPPRFHLIGAVQVNGHTLPFDVTQPADHFIDGQPSGVFAPIADSDDVALDALTVRAMSQSVPGNRAIAVFSTTVQGVPVDLRIGGRVGGVLGSGVATPQPVP